MSDHVLTLTYPLPVLSGKRTPRKMLQHYIAYNKMVDKIIAEQLNNTHPHK